LKGVVVLFIDDLQWSDVATLDLLKNIVLDGEIPGLLIVGAYREDEVPE
jgi:predicted ATPase